MTIEREMLIERRRVRRRLTLWRVAAAVLGLLLLIAVVVKADKLKSGFGRDQIARVYISGMITDDADQQKLLKKLGDSKKVKAIILRVNSPGGTTVGGEALYLRIREIAKKKPVVAAFGTVAASAAYMLALGTDHIVTRGNTITGSVGVLVQWPDVADLMSKLGVTMEELKSGPLKAVPSPFAHAKESDLGPMRDMVTDTFDWFVKLVATRRGIDPAAIPGLRQGAIYSGREAVKLKLADEIGGEEEAVAWLVKEKKIDKKLPIVEHKPENEHLWGALSAVWPALGRLFGLAGVAHWLPLEGSTGRFAGDGLMSVWRPALTKQ